MITKTFRATETAKDIKLFITQTFIHRTLLASNPRKTKMSHAKR